MKQDKRRQYWRDTEKINEKLFYINTYIYIDGYTVWLNVLVWFLCRFIPAGCFNLCDKMIRSKVKQTFVSGFVCEFRVFVSERDCAFASIFARAIKTAEWKRDKIICLLSIKHAQQRHHQNPPGKMSEIYKIILNLEAEKKQQQSRKNMNNTII